MKALSIFASATFLLTAFSHAGGEGWVHDFEAAKKKAAAEKKDLLIDFTGSDWCGWCIRLNKEVFSHDEFKTGVKDKFILVELDYPRDKSKLDAATIKQNEELQKKYQPKGFPTILLTDAEGRPYAATGYQKGGAVAYVKHLDELRGKKSARDEAFAKAAAAKGVAKAKALYTALQTVPEDFRSLYEGVITDIKKLDPKDETGLAKAEKTKKAKQALEQGFGMAMQSGQLDKAVSIADDFIKEHKLEGEAKQEIMAMKLNAYLYGKKMAEAEKGMDELIAVDPKSEIAVMVAGFKAGRFVEMKKQVEAEKKAAEAKPEATSETSEAKEAK